MPIVIRPVQTLEECDHFQRVEQRVWGSDEESIVPEHVLITLVHNGGLVMGAWAEDGPADTGGMVGIVAGWLGAATPPGAPAGARPQLKFCSHMAGVLPQWQRRRVGLRLKLAQLDWVRAQGLTDWVTWTFDPLQRANAVFNIHRLGATCRTYISNLYGEMTDMVNAGGPSDRCQVDWWINSPRVCAAAERAAAHQAAADPIDAAEAIDAAAAKHGVPAKQAAATPSPAPRHEAQRIPGLQVLASRPAGPFRAPPDAQARLDGAPVALPIPEEIAAIRRADRSLSLHWRTWLRAELQRAFAANYSVTDCLHVAGRDWCYILTPDTHV